MTEPAEHADIVSSTGRVMVPSGVRRQLGLTPASVLRLVLDGVSVQLLASIGDIRKLKGRLSAKLKPVSLQDMDDIDAQRRACAGRS